MTKYDQMSEDQKFLDTIARNTNVLQFMVVCFIAADVMLFLILLKVVFNINV